MNSEKVVSVVGERIRERRIELGLSQEELAKSVGYQTRMAIFKIEKGESELPLSKLWAMCRALDVSPEWLLLGSNKKKEKTETKEESKTASPLNEAVIDVISRLSEGDKRKVFDFALDCLLREGRWQKQ